MSVSGTLNVRKVVVSGTTALESLGWSAAALLVCAGLLNPSDVALVILLHDPPGHCPSTQNEPYDQDSAIWLRNRAFQQFTGITRISKRGQEYRSGEGDGQLCPRDH